MKNLFILFFLNIALQTSAFDPETDNDVLCYYRFDSDIQNIAQDHSTHGRDAELSNIASGTGILGGSAVCNNRDSYISAGNTPDVESYTMIAWIKPYSYGETSGENAKLIVEKTYSYYMNILSTNEGNRNIGHIRIGGLFSTDDGSRQKWEFLDSPDQIPLNEWTFVAGSFKNGTFRLYINGEKVAEKTILPVLKNYTYNTVWGALQKKETGFYHGSFHGELDECMLVARALTDSEISNWYARFKHTSSNKLSNTLFKVYPNPSGSYITIESSQEYNITVQNLHGKCIRKMSKIEGTCQFSTLNLGKAIVLNIFDTNNKTLFRDKIILLN